MLILWTGWALAASPYADRNADVAVEGAVGAELAAVQAALEDLEVFREILPCASDWAPGTSTAGVGASMQLTYDVGSMHRRLTAVVSRSEPGRFVDYDHPGNKGFVTRWMLTEQEAGGTAIELTTFLNPPPWPFRKMYFERIQPMWTECYSEALSALDDRLPAAAPEQEPVPEVPPEQDPQGEETETVPGAEITTP